MSYLNEKRLLLIQKSRKPLQVEIQMIHNEAVDERVFELTDDDYNNTSSQKIYDEPVLLKRIGELNLRATTNDIRRLNRHSILSHDDIARMEMINSAKNISDQLTKLEVERIGKNLEYIEETIKRANLELDVYKGLIKNNPIKSRKNILEQALTEGKSPVSGREYSFKELDNFSKDLERYKDHQARLDKAMNENSQLQREGYDPIHNKKVWVWSRLEHTRHRKMEGQTVGLYEKFTVQNEVNGDVDYLRFPGDIQGSCSNTCNCMCTFQIK